MEPQPPDDGLHSPLRYLTSGTGCGCGCLGLLVLLVAAIGLVAIPLELYAEGPGNAGMWGVLGIATGLSLCFVGGAAWVGSLFMD